MVLFSRDLLFNVFINRVLYNYKFVRCCGQLIRSRALSGVVSADFSHLQGYCAGFVLALGADARDAHVISFLDDATYAIRFSACCPFAFASYRSNFELTFHTSVLRLSFCRDAEDAVHARDGYDYDGYRLRVEFPRGSAPGRGGMGPGRGRGPPARRSQYRVLVSGERRFSSMYTPFHKFNATLFLQSKARAELCSVFGPHKHSRKESPVCLHHPPHHWRTSARGGIIMNKT